MCIEKTILGSFGIKIRMVVLSDPAIIKELFNDPLTTGRQASNHPVLYELSEGPYGW